jgi:anti-anti-sigma regulatory factor
MDERPVGEVMILALTGRIATGADELALGDKVRSVFYQGYRKVLLDLGSVSSSNACGISALLGALLDARVARAELKLIRLTRRITNLQVIVALTRYFDVFESEEAALESFGDVRQGRTREEPAKEVWESVTAA